MLVDEAWLLMREPAGASFLYRLAKSARKRWCGLTTITQDAGDLLATELGHSIVSNAASQILLRQAPQAIDQVADAFRLTDGEQRYLLTCPQGHGLFVVGDNRFPLHVLASPGRASARNQRPRRTRGDRVKAAVGAASFLLLLPVLFIAAALGGSEQSEPTVVALSDIPPAYLALYEQAASRVRPPLAAARRGRQGRIRPRPRPREQPAQRRRCRRADAVPARNVRGIQLGKRQHAPEHHRPARRDLRRRRDARRKRRPDDTTDALYAYNHADWYVNDVLSWAAIYASITDGPVADAGPAADAAVGYALAQLGTPYLWGGEEPGGFDCSGLVQAAYDAAGIKLPRVAQAQYDHGPPVPAGQPLQPGDLVFFGTDTAHVDHVGIVVNQSEMVDAPHTGALVRIEPFSWPDYLGATRPAT